MADGWGVRACAAALTVGKDLCKLSILGKFEETAHRSINSTPLTDQWLKLPPKGSPWGMAMVMV